MDIGAYQINNIQSVTQPVQGGGVTPGVPSAADLRAQEALSRLSNGQTIEGRVVSVETSANGQRTAQIDIGNQTVVSARLDSSMALAEGANVTFQVRTGMSGTISLNPLYRNTAMDSSALRALSQAGISPDAQTLQMVREMMSSGLSIDRESVQTMARAMTEFPNAEMTTLTAMRGLDLPITENTLTQFSNYQNYQHQIISSISDLMNGLPQAFTTMTQTGNAVQALDMYGAMMRMFTVPEEEVIDRPYLNATAAEAPAAVLGDVTSGLPGSTAGEASLLPEGFAFAEQATAGAAGAEAGIEDFNPFGGMDKQTAAVAAENAAVVELASGGDRTPASAPARTLMPDGTPVSGQPAQGAGLQEPDTAEPFGALVRQVGLTGDIENMSASDLMKALSEQYRQTAHTSPALDQAWTKLFSSKEFNGLLQDTMTNQWLLRPEQVGEKGNIEALYGRLGKHAQQLTNLLESTLGPNTPLAQNAANLSNNLDFMNQLNQMFQYVQLPLKMQNQNAHGDLYVYTNRRSLARDDGTVSAILHLDMEALGPLDVYLKMQDNKVNTNFYMADDAALDLVAEHIEELNERLQKRGYTMTARMMLQSEMSGEDAAVDEMLKVNPGGVGIVSEQSFDARA